MNKADRYMPLWIGDYLADTAHLTTQQHGAYMLLIMWYWRKGAIPNNDGILTSITKMTPAEWRKNKATILDFFTLADGYYMHTRIEKELGRSKSAYEKAKSAADARWDAKSMLGASLGDAKRDAKRDAKLMLGACQSESESELSISSKKRRPTKNVKPVGSIVEQRLEHILAVTGYDPAEKGGAK